MALSSLPKTISGFNVLPVTYTSSSIASSSSSSSSSSITHIIYARPHSGGGSTKNKNKNKFSQGKGKERQNENESANGQDEEDEKTDVLPEGRTLFLVNVPPDATERELVLFFKPAGTVERVIFNHGSRDVTDSDRFLEDDDDDEDENDGEADAAIPEDSDATDSEADDVNGNDIMDTDGPSSKRRFSTKSKSTRKGTQPPKVKPLPAALAELRKIRRTGQTAHVVFLDASSLAHALDPPTSKKSNNSGSIKPRPWPTASTSSGLARYRATYAALRPPLDTVSAHVDSWMERFEFDLVQKKHKQQQESGGYKKGEAIVDDDGFTLVTRGGAYGQTLGGGVGVASRKFVEAATNAAAQGEGDGIELGGGAGAGGRRGKKKKEKKEKDSFYAFQKAEKQRDHLRDLQKKWEEDKAKVEKLRQSRRFKPY